MYYIIVASNGEWFACPSQGEKAALRDAEKADRFTLYSKALAVAKLYGPKWHVIAFFV